MLLFLLLRKWVQGAEEAIACCCGIGSEQDIFDGGEGDLEVEEFGFVGGVWDGEGGEVEAIVGAAAGEEAGEGVEGEGGRGWWWLSCVGGVHYSGGRV